MFHLGVRAVALFVLVAAAVARAVRGGLGLHVVGQSQQIALLALAAVDFGEGVVGVLADGIEEGLEIGRGKLVNYYQLAVLSLHSSR